MASFTILDSRRLDLETCQFDVTLDSGEWTTPTLFRIQERGSMWEYVIVSIETKPDLTTLSCRPWLPQSGAFIGLSATTRPLNAKDKKRYARILDQP